MNFVNDNKLKLQNKKISIRYKILLPFVITTLVMLTVSVTLFVNYIKHSTQTQIKSQLIHQEKVVISSLHELHEKAELLAHRRRRRVQDASQDQQDR